MPISLDEYVGLGKDRNDAMVLAYLSGGYGMKEIGDYCGVHYSRVSRIVNAAKAKGKT